MHENSPNWRRTFFRQSCENRPVIVHWTAMCMVSYTKARVAKWEGERDGATFWVYYDLQKKGGPSKGRGPCTYMILGGALRSRAQTARIKCRVRSSDTRHRDERRPARARLLYCNHAPNREILWFKRPVSHSLLRLCALTPLVFHHL